MEKIVIGREAYDKIMHFVHKAKFEISGLGNVQVIDGVPTVTDIILLKQENHSTETEMDGDAIAKALYDHHEAGMEGELKFWWHSHVDMKVFWSATDMTTIEDLTKNGWFIHGVFNKKNEYKCAYSNNEPVKVFIDNIDMEIDEDLINDDGILEATYEILSIEDENEKAEKIIVENNKEIKEIDGQISSIIASKCDPLFDELVTDKMTVYNYENWRNRNAQGQFTENGGNTTMGKLMASSKESKTETSQTSSTTPSTGTMGMGGTGTDNYYMNSEFLDPYGAIELFIAGFTEEEIIYLQTYCSVYDADDLAWYESEFGGVRSVLDEDVNQKTTA